MFKHINGMRRFKMKILEHVSEQEVLDLVLQMVGTESHKECDQKEETVAKWIAAQFEKEGIDSSIDVVVEGRPNAYGVIKGDDESIMLMLTGHTDTVPGFKMKYDPFKPFIEDGKVYGRGSVDMKGALAAMMAAMFAVKRSGVKLSHTAMFAGVIDEEECSQGSEHMIKTGIVPKHVIIGEPTNLEVAIAHKGMEWIEVKFKGVATHGSRPKEGINAIYAAALFSNMVREELEPKIDAKTFPLLGNGSINIGKIKGGDDPNIVPDECTLEIDRRWLPSETLESIHNEIEALAIKAADVIGATVEVRAMRELTSSMINAPYSIDATDAFVKDVCDISGSTTGTETIPRDFPGWSDAGLIGIHTPAKCIIMGPGDIVQAHANDEFCSVEQIMQASEIYYQLILKMCK